MRRNILLHGSRLAYSKHGLPISVVDMHSLPLDVHLKVPKPGSMLVKMHASLIDSEDLLAIKGKSLRNTQPGPAGMTGTGIVSSVGAGVLGFQVGDHVLLMDAPGCWTTIKEAYSSKAFLLPRELALDKAAYLPPMLTAWAILRGRQSDVLQDGSIVLNGISTKTILGNAFSFVGSQLGLNIINDWTASRNAAIAVTTASGKICTDLTRRLGKGGTLITIPGIDIGFPESVSVGLPVAASIFNNVSVEGFELCSWIQANPIKAQEAVSELALYLLADSTKFLPYKGFTQHDFGDALTSAQKGHISLFVLTT